MCDDQLVSALVWYDAWQMDCCGEPFAVGDTVVWKAYDDGGEEWLDTVLGPSLAATVTHVEEHHAEAGDLVTVEGRVRAIRATWCAYGAAGSDDQSSYPVKGSVQFLDVSGCMATERGIHPKLQFVGWLVDLG